MQKYTGHILGDGYLLSNEYSAAISSFQSLINTRYQSSENDKTHIVIKTNLTSVRSPAFKQTVGNIAELINSR